MISASRVSAFLAFFAVVAVALAALSLRSEAGVGTTWVVNSTADTTDGTCGVLPADECTLREAFGDALAGDDIDFDIPGTDAGCDVNGVCTIMPASTLALGIGRDNITVNGYSQPGASANTLGAGNNAILKIVIDMSAAPASTDGIRIQGNGVTIRGLAVRGLSTGADAFEIWSGQVANGNSGNKIAGNFIGIDEGGTTDASAGHGVNVLGSTDNEIGGDAPAGRNVISGLETGVVISPVGSRGSSGNVVKNSYIGTDASGTSAVPNGIGIQILSSTSISQDNNVIGSTASDARNVISGNTAQGFYFSGAGLGTGTIVQGNYIGTDATGTVAIPNDDGIQLAAGSGTTIGGTATGAGNLISGNTSDGLYIQSSTSASVLGNLIGTNAAGTAVLGNGGIGVNQTAGLDTVIGNLASGGRNVISGNLLGVSVTGGVNSVGTTIRGNLIGTDVTGTADLGNSSDGVSLGLSDADITIQFNVISGNGSRGILTSSNGSNIIIQGNRIGTDLSGNNALPNDSHGMLVRTPDSIVGGPAAFRNTIAFNGADGVSVGSAATGVEIRSNSIHSNGDLGIDLGSTDGVTANDPGDADSGDNNKQNWPVLTSAVAGSLVVQGTLDSTASTQFTVRIFVSDVCDPSGNGEGQRVVGSASITTNGSGIANFSVGSTDTFTIGDQVTATVTNTTTADTSEFSNCVTVALPATPTPTPSPTPFGETPTPTPTPTPTGQTPTPTPTATPTPIPLETDPPTPTASPTPEPTPTPTPTVTPTPTPTPPGQTPTPTSTGPTPTATPTPTPGGESPTPTGSNGPELKQGDVDCDNNVTSVDALKQLRYVAQLSVLQNEPCPNIGDNVASFFGDVDCSGAVTSVDALKVLRHVALLSVVQTEPCPDIGHALG